MVVWVLMGVLGALFIGDVKAHGYLADPPARTANCIIDHKNTKLGQKIPRDYNKNQLFCGGKGVQWDPKGNNGNCGVCGDNWADGTPRDHEKGGKYVGNTTVISKTYAPGQAIDVTVKLTANHLGHFEFRLCVRNDTYKILDHDCLNRHLLHDPTTNKTVFLAGNRSTDVIHKVQLPPGVECQYCVLQWKYITGNDWGWCGDGTGRKGCSQTPEQFFGCADISIVSGSRGGATGSWTSGVSSCSGSTGGSGSGGGSAGNTCASGCHGVGVWKAILDNWCCWNCAHGNHCPTDHCTPECKPSTSVTPANTSVMCVPTEAYKYVTGMAEWCNNSCSHIPPNCPTSHCTCL